MICIRNQEATGLVRWNRIVFSWNQITVVTDIWCYAVMRCPFHCFQERFFKNDEDLSHSLCFDNLFFWFQILTVATYCAWVRHAKQLVSILVTSNMNQNLSIFLLLEGNSAFITDLQILYSNIVIRIKVDALIKENRQSPISIIAN